MSDTLDGTATPFDLNDYIGRILGFNDTYGTRPLRCDICDSLTNNHVAMQMIMFGPDGGAVTQQWGGGGGHIAICGDCMLNINAAATAAISTHIIDLKSRLLLTCSDCGNKKADVRNRECAYSHDLHGMIRWESVCDNCEQDHIRNI